MTLSTKTVLATTAAAMTFGGILAVPANAATSTGVPAAGCRGYKGTQMAEGKTLKIGSVTLQCKNGQWVKI